MSPTTVPAKQAITTTVPANQVPTTTVPAKQAITTNVPAKPAPTTTDDDKNAKSGKDDHEGKSDGYAETQITSEDLKGLHRLKRIAMDATGNPLKDKNGKDHWNKYLAINNKNRTYIIQEKKENKWKLVPTSSNIPFHNFTEVSKVTKHTDNTIFNNVGNSVMIDNFRITLWTKDLMFDVQRYLSV